VPKTYFNDAIIGNSSMLGCITAKGELTRLFWPFVDYRQQIDKFLCGIFNLCEQNSTMWLSSGDFQHCQGYIEDTNIVETLCVNRYKGLEVRQTDFVLPQKDVLIRHVEIKNTGNGIIEPAFILFSQSISTTDNKAGILLDFDCDALIHYRHDNYLAISADREIFKFQLGNNAYESALFNDLRGFDSIGMMSDGAVSWKLNLLSPGEAGTITICVCAASKLNDVKENMKKIKEKSFMELFNETKVYWEEFIKSARNISTGVKEIDSLYKRSLLVFALMRDKKTGGILAAPEIDEEFTRCGRYAYCWGRDAAFITSALDICGLSQMSRQFYVWAAGVQDTCGVWHQRYHVDGNLGPSWGIQIDETGTIIWGILKHYEFTKDKDFLIKMWKTVRLAVDFLINFTDAETGLPKPSFDLWEERFGEHAYSSAAVYAGIRAGAEIARILNIPGEFQQKWELAAEKMKESILMNFWKEEYGRFFRSVRVKLNPWGNEPSANTVIVKVNPKGYKRELTAEDSTVDVSLLGLSIPFEVLDVSDCRMRSTVDVIEKRLTNSNTGGIKRYENDNYMGGNPWILTTLWVALYHIRTGNHDKAKEYLKWAVKSCTPLGLLPEQVGRDDGRPAWVIPLTWSHAMFVHVLSELTDAGVVF